MSLEANRVGASSKVKDSNGTEAVNVESEVDLSFINGNKAMEESQQQPKTKEDWAKIDAEEAAAKAQRIKDAEAKKVILDKYPELKEKYNYEIDKDGYIVITPKNINTSKKEKITLKKGEAIDPKKDYIRLLDIKDDFNIGYKVLSTNNPDFLDKSTIDKKYDHDGSPNYDYNIPHEGASFRFKPENIQKRDPDESVWENFKDGFMEGLRKIFRF